METGNSGRLLGVALPVTSLELAPLTEAALTAEQLKRARLLAVRSGWWDTGFLAETNEFSNRCNPEFLHDPAAMYLDSFHGNAQYGRDLFVQHGGKHLSHDFLLARCQR